jgi:flagellar basal body rod protein FlgC
MDSQQQIPLLSLAAGAMDAQRGALDIYARNVAAAQVAGSGGFTRFEPELSVDEQGIPYIHGTHAQHVASGGIITEMLAMMQAQRAYEGDATVFTLGKHLAEQTIAIERS